MTGRKPMTGGCQCGAVRYRLNAPPQDVHLCHCRMCQKAMGNLFAALAPMQTTNVVYTRGQPALFQSSSVAIRGFCAECGTPLSFNYIGSEWIAMTIGSLDDPAAARPGIHYGTEAKMPWLHEIFGGVLPGEPTDPDSERLKGLADFQHPDADTIEWLSASQ